MFKFCTSNIFKAIILCVKNFFPSAKHFCKGFTLAEVLITLGIIGIVAAMTIPTLIKDYRRAVSIAKLKKTYSTLQQAIQRTVADNLGYSYVNFSDGNTQSMIDWYNYYLKPNLRIQKDCFDEAGCWHKEGVTKMLNGNIALWDEGTKGIGGNIIVFRTFDNVYVNMDGAAASDIVTHFGVNINAPGLVIHVDVNGDEGPNVIGRDIFVFVFNNRLLLPAGNDKTSEEVDADCSENGTGYYCFSYILRNNWKIKDDMIL